MSAQGRDRVQTNVSCMAAQLDRQVSGNEFSGLVGWTRPKRACRTSPKPPDAWTDVFSALGLRSSRSWIPGAGQQLPVAKGSFGAFRSGRLGIIVSTCPSGSRTLATSLRWRPSAKTRIGPVESPSPRTDTPAHP
jgi:hypothetical protein